MISGSCRMALRSASAKESVSVPTSRWLTSDFLSRIRYSMGSSMVMICELRCVFICSTMLARVVVFPVPVAPVTRINPRDSMASFSTTGGRFSSSMVWIFIGMTRMTIPMVERCWKMLTRKRPRPGTLCAMSISRFCLKCSRWLSFITEKIIRTASSWLIRGFSLSGTKRLSIRMTGGPPTLMWRSEAFRSTAIFRSSARSMAPPALGFLGLHPCIFCAGGALRKDPSRPGGRAVGAGEISSICGLLGAVYAQEGPELFLDVVENGRVFVQESLRVFAPLTDPVSPVGVPGTALFDHLVNHPQIEEARRAGDAPAEDDVEFGFAEGGRDLVLHHLHAHPIPDHRLSVFDRRDLPDIESDGGGERAR